MFSNRHCASKIVRKMHMQIGVASLQMGKSDWQAVQQAPPWAVDAWGLGCLMQEVYSGQFLTRTEDLRNVASISKGLLPVRLQGQ